MTFRDDHDAARTRALEDEVEYRRGKRIRGILAGVITFGTLGLLVFAYLVTKCGSQQ